MERTAVHRLSIAGLAGLAVVFAPSMDDRSPRVAAFLRRIGAAAVR